MSNQRLATVGGAAATPGGEGHLVELGHGQRDSTIELEHEGDSAPLEARGREIRDTWCLSCSRPPVCGPDLPSASPSGSQRRGAWAVQLQGLAPWVREQSRGVGNGAEGKQASDQPRVGNQAVPKTKGPETGWLTPPGLRAHSPPQLVSYPRWAHEPTQKQ